MYAYVLHCIFVFCIYLDQIDENNGMVNIQSLISYDTVGSDIVKKFLKKIKSIKNKIVKLKRCAKRKYKKHKNNKKNKNDSNLMPTYDKEFDKEKYILVKIDNSMDLFEIEDLKLIPFFKLQLSQRWVIHDAMVNAERYLQAEENVITLKVPSLIKWNVGHLKSLINCIKHQFICNEFESVPFNISYFESLFACEDYLTGGQSKIFTKNAFLMHLYTLDNDIFKSDEFKRALKLSKVKNNSFFDAIKLFEKQKNDKFRYHYQSWVENASRKGATQSYVPRDIYICPYCQKQEKVKLSL